MIYSLRWQLLLSLVLVILVTVGMTAFFASQAATAEIERLQGQDDNARNQRLGNLVEQNYLQSRGWSSAQRLLKDVSVLYGQRVVLVNPQGVVVGDSHNTLVGETLNNTVNSRAQIAVLGPEGRVGTLLVSPEIPAPAPVSSIVPDPAAGPSLNLLLTLSGLLAVGVAMLLTFFLSRRILAPVESLSRAARLASQRDFSARAEVRSRDEVGELGRTFNSMITELSRVEEVRRSMVADVAHELRTPVTNIRGYIEGVSDGIIEPTPDILESMKGEVMLLTRLIEDLQDLALAESGQIQLRRQPCDLSELARRSASAIQPQAQTKGIELQVDAEGELLLEADPERVSQVLRNLLVNAVTYTPAGSQITVLTRQQNGYAQVTVRDTGPGIPPEELPYVFERFYRVDKSRSRSTGGVGLGLTISRRLVEAHGGAIQARSELGQGTEFVVMLPHDEGNNHHPELIEPHI